jgi:hypothetical protein
LQQLCEPLRARAAAIQLCCFWYYGKADSFLHLGFVSSLYRAQILAFASAAVFSAIFFCLDYRLLLWRVRGKEVHGDRVWKNMRRFCGYMCVGCIAGVVESFLLMQSHHLFYASFLASTRRQFYELQAASFRHDAAYNMFRPLYIFCFIFAVNMLLRRVSDHASHSYYNIARDSVSSKTRFDWRDCVGQYPLYKLVRSFNFFCVVLCSLIALVDVVETAFRAEKANLFDEAAASTNADGSDTLSSLQIFNIAERNTLGKYQISTAVERSLVALLLVLMSFAYTLYFPACIVMFRRIELKLDSHLREMSHRSDTGSAFLPFEFCAQFSPETEVSGVQVEMPIVEARSFLQNIKSSAYSQKMRFLSCLLLELTTLNVLTVHALFVAISVLNPGDFSPDCGLCKSCQTVNMLMRTWSSFTPELIPLLALLCIPLPLMFSLWLMTTPEDRELLLNPSIHLKEGIDELHPDNRQTQSNRAERVRLGIDLK